MHVALDILHVIRPEQDVPPGSESWAADGETGEEKETAPRADAHMLTSEDPARAIANYIDTHRNIVLAIYDSWVGGRNIHNETRAGDVPGGFEKPLTVPLVVVRA
jgi:hypothetical protein